MARKGEKQTEAWLARMRGRKNTPETIEKMRQNRKGKGGRSGPDNPQFGKVRTPEEREHLRQMNLGKQRGNQHAKGYRHTADARARISAAMKALWEKRLEAPEQFPSFPMLPERSQGIRGQITRGRWTSKQRREWKDPCCAFCGSTEQLQLDHIIPVFLGGKNTRDNCQTLCEPCNHWKHEHIDRPQYQAFLQAGQGATC